MTKYKSILIPAELDAQLEKLVGYYGYKSKMEIVREAIRRLLFDVEKYRKYWEDSHVQEDLENA